MSSSEGISALGSFSSSEPQRSDATTDPKFSRPATKASTGAAPHQSTYLLASKLRAKFGDRPSVLVLTSVTSGEGVSPAAADLGRVLALSKGDDSVLIIDSNLTAPSQHVAFGLPRSPGLVELLSGDIGVNDAVSATRWPKLYVLPAGASAGLLQGAFDAASYEQIVATLRSHFHTIVVDSPALSAREITPFVATSSDGVLLMVAPGRHDRGRVRASLAEIAALGVEVVGTCLAQPGEPNRPAPLAGLRASIRAFFRKIRN